MSDFPKFCPECGSALPEEVKFCPECGANLITESTNNAPIIEENINEANEEVIAEEPVIKAETITPVTETPKSTNLEKRKNNTTLGIVIILLVVVAIAVAVLYKMDFINFGNGNSKETSTTTKIEDTSSTTEIQTTETTTTTTETTTEKASVDPLSFMGKSVDELIEMYSEDCESYSIEGAHYVQFYDKNGKFVPYAFIFWSDPFIDNYQSVVGYTCGPKGTEFYKGLKIGDSLETFKKVTGVTDVEIYYDQEWAAYMAVKIPLDYGFTIDLEFSDHNGTEITYVEVVSSY